MSPPYRTNMIMMATTKAYITAVSTNTRPKIKFALIFPAASGWRAILSNDFEIEMPMAIAAAAAPTPIVSAAARALTLVESDTVSAESFTSVDVALVACCSSADDANTKVEVEIKNITKRQSEIILK